MYGWRVGTPRLLTGRSKQTMKQKPGAQENETPQNELMEANYSERLVFGAAGKQDIQCHSFHLGHRRA
jgi:hypothetical protein